MNYCSLEDAWGKNNYISNQYKKYESDTIIEPMVNYDINDNQVIPEDKKCVFTCDDFIDHLNKCQKCRMKIKNNLSSKIIKKINHIIFYNKDMILLILIVLFILIFLNLLFSIIKN